MDAQSLQALADLQAQLLASSESLRLLISLFLGGCCGIAFAVSAGRITL